MGGETRVRVGGKRRKEVRGVEGAVVVGSVLRLWKLLRGLCFFGFTV